MNLTDFLGSYLMAYLFWLSIALGCLTWRMIANLVGGKWPESLTPFLQKGSIGLFALSLLFIPILASVSFLYPWANMNASTPVFKYYLTPWSFILRSVFYLLVWIGLSLALDRARSPEGLRRWSALGLVVLALTMSFASIDWVMSLEPNWYSTSYGLIWIVGSLFSGLIFLVSIRYYFLRKDFEKKNLLLTSSQDLGNLILAMVVVWGYVSFIQYFIIWLGNLPREVTWVVNRSKGGWQWIAAILGVFQLSLPLLLLLQIKFKKNPAYVFYLSLTLLGTRLLEIYWLVAPGLGRKTIQSTGIEVIFILGIGMIWWIAWNLPREAKNASA